MVHAAARYAVIGHPISHSRSPFIHARFADQLHQAMRYVAIDVAPERFREQVEGLRAEGLRGLNVTVPLKELAFDYARTRTARAARAGAVNTLVFGDDGSILGDNTDGVGLYRDLTRNLGWPVADQRILILGAGGAVRGVMEPLLQARPRELVVANRTRERAQELVERFRDQPAQARAAGLDELAGCIFDLLINGTSAGLTGDALAVGPGVFAPGARAYDMIYAPGSTPFLDWASAAGVAQRADGRGMLVEQAAESFFLWRGLRPETAPVIAALTALLGAP